MKIKPTLESVKGKIAHSKERVIGAIKKEGKTSSERRDQFWRAGAGKLSTISVIQFDAEKALKKEHLYSDPTLYKRAVTALSQYSAIVPENPKVEKTDSALAVADAVSQAMKNVRERRNAILGKMYREAAPQDRVRTCLLLAQAAVQGMLRRHAQDCLSYLYHQLLTSDPIHRQNKNEYQEFAFIAEIRIGDYAKVVMSYEAMMDGLTVFVRTSPRAKICSMIYAQILEGENCIALTDRNLEKTSDVASLAFANFIAQKEEEWFISEGDKFSVNHHDLGF